MTLKSRGKLLSKCVFLQTQPWRSASNYVQIRKVLVANRGEIACRVMRTAKKLGIQTVAVYSDADTSAAHVEMADEAYNIGLPPSQESYLRREKIIDIAKCSGCQAIHPGYGFLSENTEFAELCHKSDIIFVGPPANAIRDMGIKSASKSIMSAAGVPVIEGYHGDDQSMAKLKQEAENIGFPVMIKAVLGGGGKGMRVAFTASEFESQLELARHEALKSFADQAVLLEKFVVEPRHVEVQIFGDHHGNCVHLFERDCSVQRRHQKIIEEAPAPNLSESLRAELGESAVKAACAVGYVGAGTVEFILDRHSHTFHFMEMNTRLQVEHAVTEMVTNTDLVEWQFRVAAGEKLPLTQEEIYLRGHAFEARIYAESPSNNFMPLAGPLHYLATPVPSADVRVETGVRQGDEVSVYYDPMIAKLIVWGKDRTDALIKMRTQLADYNIVGVDTNVDFLLDLCKHSEFISGNVHTNFIEHHRSELLGHKSPPDHIVIQAVLVVVLNEQLEAQKAASASQDPFSPFFSEIGMRLNHLLVRDFSFRCGKEAQVTYKKREGFLVRVSGAEEQLDVSGTLSMSNNRLELICHMDKKVVKSHVVITPTDVHLFTRDGSYQFSLPVPKFKSAEIDDAGATGGDVAVAPMPGVVEKVYVKLGDVVKAGDPLFIITAMKMEYVIHAPRDGQIEKINCSVGENVSKNAVMVKLREEGKDRGEVPNAV
ncbi:methylcrotonoyl-CoA carboxylase subunit alpha, mitochondrial isoform X2 [Zootermopsis nevadensis]|uniref:methylcrotonoyl-CoA carboxylase subunit alpha, mitochondrial isoform X2 n=1 Tax=Zootermopsis nevadensis TaxID=136037 RepID=UPI000B8E4CB8|nr:methylcrotonoyl-CoA carboxylase subunit alpha, mitochondrial isoform X2 [Zootermopsis nevadensis]